MTIKPNHTKIVDKLTNVSLTTLNTPKGRGGAKIERLDRLSVSLGKNEIFQLIHIIRGG